jgi:hypothetical protein
MVIVFGGGVQAYQIPRRGTESIGVERSSQECDAFLFLSGIRKG